MNVKPLNLKILIGDMNRNSPPITPRLSQSKRSRIPLATVPPQIPVATGAPRGVTPFRQWADPPPPPQRSRAQERKNPIAKKRTGSADPRFRRSLDTSKNSPEKIDTGIPVKHSNSVCELSIPALDSPSSEQNDKKPEHLEEPPSENQITPHIQNDLESADIENERSLSPSPTRSITTSDIFFDEEDNNKEDEEREKIKPTKPEITVEDAFSDRLDLGSDVKYSQTDAEFNFINDIDMVAETIIPDEKIKTPEIDNTEIIHYVQAINNKKTARYLDGLILNRTRSISSVFELEPVKIKRPSVNKRKSGSISHVFLKHSYWTYVEMWAALSFVFAMLLFGWYYLIPYLIDIFNTWIFPRPPLTASGYLRKSFSDIFGGIASSVYNLLTTPANRRLS